jgi:hypothetical protein
LYASDSSLEIVSVPAACTAEVASTPATDGASSRVLAISLRRESGSGGAEFKRLLGGPVLASERGIGQGGDVFEPGLQAVLSTIKQRIAHIVYHPTVPSDTDNIVLTVTGMSAIFTAFRAAIIYHSRVLEEQLPTPPAPPAPQEIADVAPLRSPPDVVVFGFPYLDTLKVRSKVLAFIVMFVLQLSSLIHSIALLTNRSCSSPVLYFNFRHL